MPMQHVPQPECHLAPTPFVRRLWLLEEPQSLAKLRTRLQAGNTCQPILRRQERSRGLCLSLVGSSRWPSLPLLPLLGLRDICPSDKADTPPDLSPTILPNESCLRWSTAPADSPKSRLQSLAERMQHQPLSDCTARPKAACPPVHPQVRHLRKYPRHAQRPSP